jgi:thiamine transporter ThiT
MIGHNHFLLNPSEVIIAIILPFCTVDKASLNKIRIIKRNMYVINNSTMPIILLQRSLVHYFFNLVIPLNLPDRRTGTGC